MTGVQTCALPICRNGKIASGCRCWRTGKQIRLVFEAFPVAAAKTGMLFSSGIIRAVAKEMRRRRKVKLVVDPVMVATSGAPLLKPEAERALARELFPLAAVVTPNLDEAARLVGRKLKTSQAAKEAVRFLISRMVLFMILPTKPQQVPALRMQ